MRPPGAPGATPPGTTRSRPGSTVRGRADAQHACVRTTGTTECVSPASIAVNGHLSAPGTADGSKQLTLLRDACPSAGAVLGTSTKRCAGKRTLTIRVRYPGRKIRRLVVTANGKRQKVLRLYLRPIVRIDLRNRPRQTTRVRILIITKSGQRLRGVRVYHPCRSRLPSRGFRY